MMSTDQVLAGCMILLLTLFMAALSEGFKQAMEEQPKRRPRFDWNDPLAPFDGGESENEE